jgi:hypothetical protein
MSHTPPLAGSEDDAHRQLASARRLPVDAEERAVRLGRVVRAVDLIATIEELLIGGAVQQI